MSDQVTVPRDVIVRLDDRARKATECLSEQLEADYPLTYERTPRSFRLLSRRQPHDRPA